MRPFRVLQLIVTAGLLYGSLWFVRAGADAETRMQRAGGSWLMGHPVLAGVMAKDNSDNGNADNLSTASPPARAAEAPTCSTPGQETAFTSFDGKVTVRVFPTMPGPMHVEILQVVDFFSAPLPPGNIVGVLVYEVRAAPCGGDFVQTLPAEVNLSIHYNDLEAYGLDESRFVIGRLDFNTATWLPVEKQARDPANNIVAATIDQPGFYVVYEAR